MIEIRHRNTYESVMYPGTMATFWGVSAGTHGDKVMDSLIKHKRTNRPPLFAPSLDLLTFPDSFSPATVVHGDDPNLWTFLHASGREFSKKLVEGVSQFSK